MPDTDDDFEYEEWMAGPEAQLWSEQAKWEADCERQVTRLLRSIPAPGTVYPRLPMWAVQSLWKLKRWR